MKLLLIILVSITSFSATAFAQIMDGGFENVSLGTYYEQSLGDGWSAGGYIAIIESGQYLSAVAHSGDQFADLNYGRSENTLTQSIAVTPNQPYDLSYWIADTSPNPLTVMFDGGVVFSGVSPAHGVTSPNDYVQYHFTVIPTQAFAVLSFTGRYEGPGGSLGTICDDVALTPIPEPSTIALVGMSGIGMIGFAWRRRK